MNKSLWRITLTANRQTEAAVAKLMAQQWNLTPVCYCPENSDQCRVSAYTEVLPDTVPGLRQTAAQADRLLQACGVATGRLRCSVRRIRREDWAESWKRHFQPFTVGRRLLVKPSWSRKQPSPGQSVVELDPGLSFGTGQHPTTRFCLEQMVRSRTPGRQQSLLDMGTGSGILAIAAVKLGYAPVQAFDFDPTSIQVAQRNARKNLVGRRLRISQQNLTALPLETANRFAVVCANLEYDLLLAESQKIVNRLIPGGRLLLSGILDRQFPRVVQVYGAQGLRLTSSQKAQGWRSGMFMYPIEVE